MVPVKINGHTVLSEQEREFCEVYVQTASVERAAKAAGFGSSSPGNAWGAGTKYLQTTRIRSYISEIIEQIQGPVIEATKLALLRNLLKISEAKITDILEEDGSFKPTSEWPDSISENVTSYQYVTDINGRAQARLTLADPIRANEALIKLLNMPHPSDFNAHSHVFEDKDPSSLSVPRRVENTIKTIYQSLSPELREEITGTPQNGVNGGEPQTPLQVTETEAPETVKSNQLEFNFDSPRKIRSKPNITKNVKSIPTSAKKLRTSRVKKFKASPLKASTSENKKINGERKSSVKVFPLNKSSVMVYPLNHPPLKDESSE